jgi:hypothetical protein
MTRQQDADADIEAFWAVRDAARRQAAQDLRAGMIRDAVACALVCGGIGAGLLFPWGAL